MSPEDFENRDTVVENNSPEQIPESEWRDLQRRIRGLLKPNESRLVDIFLNAPKNGDEKMIFVNNELKNESYRIVQQIFYSSWGRRFLPLSEINRSIDELLQSETGRKIEDAILCAVYYTVKKGIKRKRFEEEAAQAGYLGADFDIDIKEEDDTHLNARNKIEQALAEYLRVLQFMAATGAKKTKPMEIDPKITERYEKLFNAPFDTPEKLIRALIFFIDEKDKVLSAIVKYKLGGQEHFARTCNEILTGSLRDELMSVYSHIKQWKQKDNKTERNKRNQTQRGLPVIQKKRKRQKTNQGLPFVQQKPTHELNGELDVTDGGQKERVREESVVVEKGFTIKSDEAVNYSVGSLIDKAREAESDEHEDEFGEDKSWRIIPQIEISEGIEGKDRLGVLRKLHPDNQHKSPEQVHVDENFDDSEEIIEQHPAIEEAEDDEPKTPSKVIEWVRRHKQAIALTVSLTVFGGALGITANRIECGDKKSGKKPSASKKIAHKKGADAGMRTFHDIKKDLDAGTAVKMDAASKDLTDAGTAAKTADTGVDAKVADAGAKKAPVKVAAKSPSKVDTIKTPVKKKDGTLNIDKGSLENLPKSAYLSMFNGEAVDVSDMPGGIISRYMEENLLEGASRSEKRAYRKYLKKLEKGWLMYMKSLETEVEDKLLRGKYVSEKDLAEYEWFKNTYSKTHKRRYRQAGWLFNKYDKLKDKKSGKAKWYKKVFEMGSDFMKGLHELNPHIKSVNDVKPGQKVWLSKKSGKTLKTIKTLYDWVKSMGKKVPKKSEVTTGEIQKDSSKVMYADASKPKHEKVHEPSVQIDSDYTKDLQSQGQTHSKKLSGMIECNTGLTSISGEIETAESLVKGVINDVRESFADVDNYYAQYEVEEESPYLEYEVEEESPYLEYKVSKIIDESEVDDYYAEYNLTEEETAESLVKDVIKDVRESVSEVDDYYAEYEVTQKMDDNSPYEEMTVGYSDEKSEEKPEPASKGLWGRLKNKTKKFFGLKAA